MPDRVQHLNGGSTAPQPDGQQDCLLCGHDYEAHEWWRDVPNKHVPCPECPDGLCLDPQEVRSA